MKKHFIAILLLLTGSIMAFGQDADKLVSSCLVNAGPNARYLKDFRIQLGKASSTGDLRYKAQMSLWKNTKYRSSLCNSDDSQGKLILTIRDDENKVVLNSYDQKTGKTYTSVEFICSKSEIYQLSYDFLNGQEGSGVGVVSMIR